jgi:hypothetical protein
MPKEYYPYLFLLEDETADGIAHVLPKLLAKSQEELFEKGRRARAFVLDQRNNLVQAQKIIQMLSQ